MGLFPVLSEGWGGGRGDRSRGAAQFRLPLYPFPGFSHLAGLPRGPWVVPLHGRVLAGVR